MAADIYECVRVCVCVGPACHMHANKAMQPQQVNHNDRMNDQVALRLRVFIHKIEEQGKWHRRLPIALPLPLPLSQPQPLAPHSCLMPLIQPCRTALSVGCGTATNNSKGVRMQRTSVNVSESEIKQLQRQREEEEPKLEPMLIPVSES